MIDTIRVLIVDDHVLFRDGLRALLASSTELELAGEASNGDEAIALATRLQPDVVLMDIQMPGSNGIEATRRIVQTSPHIAVLVVTMFDDDPTVFAVMRAGARGFLLKGASHDEMLRAIQAVSNGEAIFSPLIAVRMMNYFVSMPVSAPHQLFPELTEREREILSLIAQGDTNTEIVDRLVLSPKTVRNHITNILSKLQVADRSEAILRVRQAGYSS